uniref:Ig-like domain-containing protein n=1 Tax=Caenorhabditis tropicalis TaxID=1561998 RepID=A0A1I7URJ7_9PELO
MYGTAGSYPSDQYPSERENYPSGKEEKKHKLKNLKDNKVVKAKIKYYTHKKNEFAIISCPSNPTQGAYTWIVANSKHTSPSFSIPGTVVLAGGLNVRYTAKYNDRRNKWEGREFKNDKLHKFRQVGCVHGATQSFVQH